MLLYNYIIYLIFCHSGWTIKFSDPIGGGGAEEADSLPLQRDQRGQQLPGLSPVLQEEPLHPPRRQSLVKSLKRPIPADACSCYDSG